MNGGKVLASPAPRQNVLRNFRQWICVLVRPARARVPAPSTGTIAAGFVMLAASIACMFLIDTAASAWARTLPQWFEDVFERITDLGLGGWFLFPFGFILLCLAAVTSPRLTPLTQGVLAMLTVRFGFLFLAIGLPGLFVTIVKRLIGRARPYVGNPDDPFIYRPFVWAPEYASMPSGHATTAASAAIAIGALWPKSRAVMWFYALVIMLSRVVVLAHHPSDVIAGALVGAVGALWLRRTFAARRLLFFASDLRAFPGPSLQRVKAALREVLRKKPGISEG
ncbi:MAG TPA: phosphatase PAP2 family protein [Xanthobacteraceae bacterium]|nr:phosphatase PAP2 family protein [Xanthobacteraceae bacterium]